MKKQHVRANQALFINKILPNEIMKRSHHMKRTTSEINRIAYNKQHSGCFTLIIKAKQTFCDNINTIDVTANTTFWRTVKPFFTVKVTTRSKITVIEKRKCERKIKKR